MSENGTDPLGSTSAATGAAVLVIGDSTGTTDVSTNAREGREHSTRVGTSQPGESSSRRSLYGYEFALDAPTWRLAKGVRPINVAAVKSKFSDALGDSFLATIAHFAETRSASACRNAVVCMTDFLEHIAPNETVDRVTSEDLINYRGHIAQRDGHESQLARSVRPFLKAWFDLQQPGVGRELVQLMDSWSLTQSPVGVAVESLDPREGPLEPAESAAHIACVMTACEDGLIKHEDMLACLLLSFSARRPKQIAELKLTDLDDTRTEEANPVAAGASVVAGTGRKMLLIHIPRAKRRGGKFRGQFRSVEVTTHVWAAAVQQRGSVINRFDKRLRAGGWELQDADLNEIRGQLPLFPDWPVIGASLEELDKLRGSGQHQQARERLKTLVAGDQWHRDAAGMSFTLRRATGMAGAESRTGEPLHVTGRRLRYTKGTDAARAGLPDEVAAYLMDHSSTESIKIYTKTLPEHAKPINKAMALAMLPLAKVFQGTLVDREGDARGGDNPQASRILYKGNGAATCGAGVRCGLGKLPRPCYTCPRFQPWLDGPHEAVLEELLGERNLRLSASADMAIVGVNDMTIIAVVEVIQRCEARRQELAHGETVESAAP